MEEKENDALKPNQDADSLPIDKESSQNVKEKLTFFACKKLPSNFLEQYLEKYPFNEATPKGSSSPIIVKIDLNYKVDKRFDHGEILKKLWAEKYEKKSKLSFKCF